MKVRSERVYILEFINSVKYEDSGGCVGEGT